MDPSTSLVPTEISELLFDGVIGSHTQPITSQSSKLSIMTFHPVCIESNQVIKKKLTGETWTFTVVHVPPTNMEEDQIDIE